MKSLSEKKESCMRDLLTSNAETVSTSFDIDQALPTNLPKTWINPQQPIATSELVHLIPKEAETTTTVDPVSQNTSQNSISHE